MGPRSSYSTTMTSARKRVQRSPFSSGRNDPDKIDRGGYSAFARDSSNISAFVPQEHQLMMRFDERDETPKRDNHYLHFILISLVG